MSDNTPDLGDDLLLADLRTAVDAKDPVPDRLLDAAKAAFSWRTIDEELAQLQFDSLADAGAGGALVRSADTAVHLSFGASEAWIEVDVTDDAVLGQVAPPAQEVRMVFGSGEQVVVECDEHGQFSFERPAAGPIRLIANLAGSEVATEWFTI